MTTSEEFQAAGLFDPEIDAGTGRVELLRWLDGQGFTLDEMSIALEAKMLGAIAGDRKIVPGPQLSNQQVQDVVGLTPEQAANMAAAFGFEPRPSAMAGSALAGPDQLGLNEPEARALALFVAASTMFSNDEALGFVRVVGSAMSKIAEAAVSLFLSDVEGPSLVSDTNELELAQTALGAVELLDDLIPLLDPVLRRHVLQSVQRSRLAIIDERERLQYRYAVGFIDLVGFTPLSRDLSPTDLAVFIRDFEARAHDAVTAHGARLVKLIGDEVMFVAPDPDSACQVAQALMFDFFTTDGDNVVPRGGVSYDPVLVRGGDYYGNVVNMASRLAGDAEPRELLVTTAFAEAANLLTFEPAQDRKLKGFTDPIAVSSLVFDN